jgi:hypothetical protein
VQLEAAALLHLNQSFNHCARRVSYHPNIKLIDTKKNQSEPHSPHHISKQDAQLHPHSLTLAAIPLSPPRPGSSEENYSVIPDLHPATTLLELIRLTSTPVSFTLIQEIG